MSKLQERRVKFRQMIVIMEEKAEEYEQEGEEELAEMLRHSAGLLREWFDMVNNLEILGFDFD